MATSKTNEQLIDEFTSAMMKSARKANARNDEIVAIVIGALQGLLDVALVDPSKAINFMEKVTSNET